MGSSASSSEKNSTSQPSGKDKSQGTCPREYVGVWKQEEFEYRKLSNLFEVAWSHLKGDGTCDYFYYETYDDQRNAEQSTGTWQVVKIAGTLYMDLNLKSGKKYHFRVVKDPALIEARMEKVDISVDAMRTEIDKYQALANASNTVAE